jgi:Ca2+-binding RTX toxin-like protein
MPSEIDGVSVISYAAAAGQANDVRVDLIGTTFTITDMGVTTIADADGPGGCQVDAIQPNKATCVDPNAKPTCWDFFNPDDRLQRVEIRLSDGNDKVDIDVAAGSNVTADTFMFGEEGDDRLIGSTCGSEMIGGPGNDYLDGGDGIDVLSGEEGDDEIHPGLGDDFDVDGLVGVTGGLGVDILSYSERATPVRIDLSASVQTAGATNVPCNQLGPTSEFAEFDIVSTEAGSQFEVIVGSQGDDCIHGSRVANTIKGEGGADKISGGLGVDTIDYSDSTSPVKVTVNDAGFNDIPGNDGLQDINPLTPGDQSEGDNVAFDVENVIGGTGNDTLIGQDEVLAVPDKRGGYEGANTLVGGPGSDLLDGKGDADTFQGDLDTPGAGDGIDTVTYEDRTEPVVGTIGDGLNDDGGVNDVNDVTGRGDTILGDIEEVLGGAGNDVLRGNDGDNFLDGGAGNDLVNGGDGADELLGSDGDDLLEGAGGNDLIAGEAGGDDLEGGAQNDQLDGGDGEDLLDGGTGADSIRGGPGFDAADYSARLGPVTASADDVGGDGEAGEGDVIASDVEDLLGGIDDDVLAGNAGAGFIDGGGGDDLLDGGGGADNLIGGAGADRATYASRTAPLAIDLTTLGGDGEAGENDDIAADIEKVSGGAGNDTIVGNAASNILAGGEGADTINGGDGFDLLHGDGGNDNLNGAGGTDQVFGDAGNDALLGGSENDTLHGGGNNDSLDGATGADVLNGNDGSDTANYAARTAAVNITLDGAPNDGQTKEGDLVKTDVENINTGSGNDNVNSADGQAGKVSCGRGRDTVADSDASDTINADCESRVRISNVCTLRSASGGRMSRSGVVRLRVRCPRAGKTTVTLRRGRSSIGRKRFSVRAGKAKTVKVKLSRKGRRAVNRARRNRLRIRATLSSVRSGKVRAARGTTRTITIKAPKGKR